MRVLVTGSEGKIGKELVKILGEHELLLIDKRSPFRKIDLAIDDLTLIKEFSPEIIFHLAASFERTDETPQFHEINQRDNITATYRLNQVLMGCPCPRQYIYASSYLVYDPMLYLSDFPLKNPRMLSECDEINPRNLIGAAKLFGEKDIEFLRRNVHKDMIVTHARIFRVFGEGGQEFVSRLLEWKEMGLPVDIWNPQNRFDYIHTSDCASALKALINFAGIFNVGYGVSTPIKSILDIIKPKTRTLVNRDKYEASCADTNEIEEMTGWQPKVNVLRWVGDKMNELNSRNGELR